MNIEGSFDPDERRREAMMDGSGFSSHLADARFDDEVIPGTTDVSPSPRSPRKSRTSRRGGRSYSEKSGRDISREIANQATTENPLSPEEQRAVTERGAAMARQALRAARSDRQA